MPSGYAQGEDPGAIELMREELMRNPELEIYNGEGTEVMRQNEYSTLGRVHAEEESVTRSCGAPVCSSHENRGMWEGRMRREATEEKMRISREWCFGS